MTDQRLHPSSRPHYRQGVRRYPRLAAEDFCGRRCSLYLGRLLDETLLALVAHRAAWDMLAISKGGAEWSGLAHDPHTARTNGCGNGSARRHRVRPWLPLRILSVPHYDAHRLGSAGCSTRSTASIDMP